MTAMTQSLTVRRIAAARMPTKWGMFQTMAFERVIVNGTRHTDTALALVLGDLTDGDIVAPQVDTRVALAQ